MQKAERVVKEELKACIKLQGFREAWKSQGSVGVQSERLPVGGAEFVVALSKKTIVSESFARLDLRRVDKNVMPVHGSLRVCFNLSVKETPSITFAPTWVDLEDRPRTTTYSWAWPKFTKPEDLLSFAESNDNCITMDMALVVERPCAFSLEHASCLKVDPAVWISIPASPMVTLVASDGFELQMPKALLCTHSSVLRAALESTMVESSSGSVRMPDVSKDVLHDFAACLYSGGIPDTTVTGWERLADLLVIADKYAVAPLAEACTMLLSVGISLKNSASLLKLSDRFGLLHLRRAVIHFAVSNASRFETICNSDEYSSLSADILRDLFAHKTAYSRLFSLREYPLMLQWCPSTLEFSDDTNWSLLHADALRRACLERKLATAGTSAELVARLSATRESIGDCQDGDLKSESAAKRPRLR